MKFYPRGLALPNPYTLIGSKLLVINNQIQIITHLAMLTNYFVHVISSEFGRKQRQKWREFLRIDLLQIERCRTNKQL